MARRPPGPRATPAARATLAARGTPAAKATAAPKVPAGAKVPKPAAKPEPASRSKPAARPGSVARPEPVTKPEPATQSAQGRPVGLRVAAAALALEAVGLAVAAVFAVVNTVDGHAYQVAGGIAATLIALATASGLVAISVCLATARPWTRVPTVLTQLFVLIAGITLLQGHRPEWGVPALALAATCLAGLFTPASLHALNRPPIKNAKDT